MRRRRWKQSVRYPRDAAADDRVGALAEELDARYGLSGQTDRWRPYALSGAGPAGGARVPVLSLDDYSHIPYVETVVGVPWYQYRARLRCGDGDLYAVARPDIEGYEAYNRECLGLGSTRLIRLEPGPSDLRLAQRLRHSSEAFASLCREARAAGGLLLHPYMGIEPVWELAEAVGREARAPVNVLAPLPHVTRLANDKVCFSEIVEGLFGADALSWRVASADPAVLTERLREAARRSEAVALKMPSCASGMGNRVFRGDAVRGMSPRDVRLLVDRFLEEKEWDGRERVLAVVWHRDVLESPSAQCWIPPLGEGEPEVEEVFQQLLIGDEGVFEGAMLSALPRRIRHDLMVKSHLICRLLQRLGYVGRCSFDALAVGGTLSEASIKFVECNGRWGGTSTPMHLMKRVFGDFRRVPYMAQDYVDPRLRGLEFRHLLEVFDGHLYDRGSGKGRVLLYNVGGVGEHGKFDLVVTGRTFADVCRFIDDRIPALIARYVRGRRPANRAIL